MRAFLLIIAALLMNSLAHSADWGREQRWADEILPAILDGDPVWLQRAGEQKFLGLWLESAPLDAAKPRVAVIVVHGMGVHPDWGINGVMRTRLAEQGLSTLSIQMPLQNASAGPGDYVETFPDASERIANSLSWLRAQGYNKVAIVSHSLGGRMVRAYFHANPHSTVKAWAALSMGFDDFTGVSVPVLDVYTEHDHSPVLNRVAAHKQSLQHPASEQRQVLATGHFYQDKEQEVTQLVRDWLQKIL